MIIAQISDTHLTLGAPDSVQRITDFERTIADINALDPAPDVIVHTGDIVHNGRLDEYERAAAIFGQARAPVYVLPGNKDDRENLRGTFAERGYLDLDFKFVAYAIDDFPVRLMVLDTLGAGNRGDFCAERFARLRDLLAKTDKPTAVFMHHPPFEVKVGPDPLHYESREVMERLREALQAPGRVTGIFCGHVHRSAEGKVGNIPAVVVTCIATALRKGEYPADMKTRPIYYVHRFAPDGGFMTESRVV
jgi:3',5'-cyclic-AMP phosphodiesterase